MTNIKHILLVIGVSLLLLIGIGWWIESSKETASEVLLKDTNSLEGPLSPQELAVTNPGITNTMNRTATLHTNKGDIEIELFEDTMPITTANFIKLAEEGFYDQTKFHRVIKNFMIQGGDPTTKSSDTRIYGTGGPGYTIQDEFVEGKLLTNTRGTIAMANTGQPNSGGSQFFINTNDNTNLDFNKEPFTSKHPVFGRVINGMDVVDTIENAETGARDIPVDPIIIEKVTISSSQ